jgi:hypothetical protein
VPPPSSFATCHQPASPPQPPTFSPTSFSQMDDAFLQQTCYYGKSKSKIAVVLPVSNPFTAPFSPAITSNRQYITLDETLHHQILSPAFSPSYSSPVLRIPRSACDKSRGWTFTGCGTVLLVRLSAWGPVRALKTKRTCHGAIPDYVKPASQKRSLFFNPRFLFLNSL